MVVDRSKTKPARYELRREKSFVFGEKVIRELFEGRTATVNYKFGEFVLDTGEKVLLRDQKPVPVTPKAFLVLQTLVENHGRGTPTAAYLNTDAKSKARPLKRRRHRRLPVAPKYF